jgi:hypothetical protein
MNYDDLLRACIRKAIVECTIVTNVETAGPARFWCFPDGSYCERRLLQEVYSPTTIHIDLKVTGDIRSLAYEFANHELDRIVRLEREGRVDKV